MYYQIGNTSTCFFAYLVANEAVMNCHELKETSKLTI